MTGSIFNEFTLLLSLSALMGYAALKLRQPLILSFIVVGIIAGPSALGWITAHSELEVLASFGVTLLLFIVGLKLDMELIRSYGKVAFIAGLGQIAFTTIAGGLLGLSLGIPLAQSLFIAFALTFSSTIIIIKVLSDKFEIDSLYGRIALGVLIVQDIVVVIAIIVLSSLSMQTDMQQSLSGQLFWLLVKGAGFLGVIALITRYALEDIVDHLAKSRELLILFAIAWAALLAMAGDLLGFGKEIGGFLAGLSLGSTFYRDAIASRLETLRNLLLLFFFLNLGASLQLAEMQSGWPAVLVFSLFVLLIKPLIVMLMMGRLRFRARTGFLTGITMGQVSEFSLILASLGVTLGYIDMHYASLITFVGVVTITLSTYMMKYDNVLYEWLAPHQKIFERETNRLEDAAPINLNQTIDTIVYGFGRHGEYVAKVLEDNGMHVLGIDFDPYRVKHCRQRKRQVRYGDAEDSEFVKSLPLDKVKLVVSTFPHIEANRTLVSSLREAGYQGKIALSVFHEHDIALFKKLKPDLLLIPYQDAAQQAAERILALV